MKKRILVLLSVVALMVVMLATSVAPAFAAWTGADGQCRGDGVLIEVPDPADPEDPIAAFLMKKDRNEDGVVCRELRPVGPGEGRLLVVVYDNRFPIPEEEPPL
jgi:hypothetical protein